jgi:hypothetical protein
LPHRFTRDAETPSDLGLRDSPCDHCNRTKPPRLQVSGGRVRLGSGHDGMRTCPSRVRTSAVIGRVGP